MSNSINNIEELILSETISKFAHEMMETAKNARFFFNKVACQKRAKTAEYLMSLLPMSEKKVVAKCRIKFGNTEEYINDIVEMMVELNDIKREGDNLVAVSV